MANKQRRYDKETGQWVTDWKQPDADIEKAAPSPDNKAVKAAPENKGE